MKMPGTLTLKVAIGSLFKGFSQVILQANTATGILFFAAIVIAGIEAQKPELILYSLVGAVLSPTLAYAMNYAEDEIKNGIWGYNAILYSIALSVFTPVSIQNVILLITGNVGIVVLTPLLAKCLGGLPVLTMPFIMMTWLACLLANVPSTVSSVETSELFLHPVDYITASINNYMEIFLLSSFAGGALVMLGLALSDRIILIITMLVSVLSVFLSQYDEHVTLNQVVNGLYGYNVILTSVAVVLFGKGNLKVNVITGAWCVAFTLISGMVLSPLFSYWSLPLLTFPFVLSTWIYLFVQKNLNMYKTIC
ncbi:urea transporter [Citrobacter sp. S2-9]|uniref:Urea transporter n=1 Tax=Citrobacter enshiensis TaxID=2971264 RepID=A0ABT8PUU0_9ENTR|nr:urea transporter [Citrobacter enshiensis]MDN8600106.1 urea transporter [Citrobacter enshiensis]